MASSNSLCSQSELTVHRPSTVSRITGRDHRRLAYTHTTNPMSASLCTTSYLTTSLPVYITHSFALYLLSPDPPAHHFLLLIDVFCALKNINSSISFFSIPLPPAIFFFFFFNDTAPPEISPLPLHAALPI